MNRVISIDLRLTDTIAMKRALLILAATTGAIRLGMAAPDETTLPPAEMPPEAAASASPTADPMVMPPPAQPVEFVAALERWRVVGMGRAFVAPDENAPQRYIVPVGTVFDVVAKSKDGKWAWAETADGHPDYFLISDIAFVEAAKPAPVAVSLPDMIAGPAQAVSTGLLTVSGQTVDLLGIHGETGPYRDQLQNLINAQGGVLTCHRSGQQYTCRFPNGIDVGRAVLFNGAAELGAGASDDYRQQAAAAQLARRGIWR